MQENVKAKKERHEIEKDTLLSSDFGFGVAHSIHIREIRMAACPCNSSAIHTVLQSFAYPESVHWSERLDIVSERDTEQFEVEDDLSRESVL